MKIHFYEIEDWEEAFLRTALPDQDLFFSPKPLSAAAAGSSREAKIISVFIGTTVNNELLEALPQLKFITTRSTGFDHIDLAACQERGVSVANVPSYGANTVAEFTFGLMLDLLRKITLSYNRLRASGSFSLEGLRGLDLAGKTLGVVGTGRIGRHVIRIARGFEMTVLACDVRPDLDFARAAGFTYRELDELLPLTDILTLHVPYLPQTRHLINEQRLARMKRGAFLINTARGGLVETDALVRAVTEGRLAGAALDVLEEEGAIKEERQLISHGHSQAETLKTLLANHILIDLEKVIITPHNAFNTQGALERILKTTVENIQGFIDGRPKNLIGG